MRGVKTKIRTIIFPALLVPYLISMLGMFSSYFAFFHRTGFRTEVASSEVNDLQVLIFSKSEFEKIAWTEENEEFEQGGKMFDVGKIEQKENFYLVYCENDSFEDLFIDFLKATSGKTKSRMIAQVQFFAPLSEFNCVNFSWLSGSPNDLVTELYHSVPRELHTPPPRIS